MITTRLQSSWTSGSRCDDSSTAAPGDGSESTRITPIPAAGGYWGLLRHNGGGATQNLSAFANGSLNVWIKTNGYPGKLEIGIASDTENRTGAEAYVQLSPGSFGYCNTNQWCTVSIPVSAFLAANPKLDLRYVNFRFIIADRFDKTGNFQRTGLPKIWIDGITWSR